MNSDAYLKVLQELAINALPLQFRQTGYFQQDGAPPHFACKVRSFIDQSFPNVVVVVVVTLLLSRDESIMEDHGAPEAGKLSRVWTRSCRETESPRTVSGAKSP